MSAPKFFRPTQGAEILPLNFDPKFLDHPFDRRIATKISELLDIANHPAYAKDTPATIAGPKSNSDEDLLEYWKEHLFSVWHMTGTVKMGNPGDPNAAVNHQFRVLGIDGLRVADMSVVPSDGGTPCAGDEGHTAVGTSTRRGAW